MSETTRAVTTPAGIEPARAVPAPPEDARGVDLAQLRRNLALTPAERIAAVVEAARAIEPLRAAGAARRADARTGTEPDGR